MAGADDVVARLGGDEFAVLLQCPQGLAQALDFGQRLLLALQESMWIAGRELFPSGSLGIALWNPATAPENCCAMRMRPCTGQGAGP